MATIDKPQISGSDRAGRSANSAVASAVVSVTDRACGFKRAPPQAAQRTTLMYFSNCRCWIRLLVER